MEDRKDDSPGGANNEKAAAAADETTTNATDVTMAVAEDQPTDSPPHRSHPVEIQMPPGRMSTSSARQDPAAVPVLNGAEGPITPRNDAGPWVFDGSAGGRVLRSSSRMQSMHVEPSERKG